MLSLWGGKIPWRPCSRLTRQQVRNYETGVDGVFGFRPKLVHDRQERILSQISVDYESRCRNPNVFRLVSAYRRHAYKYAQVNPVPVGERSTERPEIDPNRYCLKDSDTVSLSGLLHLRNGGDNVTVTELQQQLDRLYCGPIAADFDGVKDEHEQEWLWKKFEELSETELNDDMRKKLAIEMLRSQNFDNFVAAKFSSVKRYGGEGAESMMGIFLELIGSADQYGYEELVIGMPHRGRLNLMTGLFQYPPVTMFRKMKGYPDFPSDQYGASDVLSHLTSSVDLVTNNGGKVHVTMLPNPSHLEAVNPVACGKVRGRQMTKGYGDYHHDSQSPPCDNGDKVVCVQVHGDAALTGQGINQETLQLSQVPHFCVGGSLHIVVNNQVGFTTPGERGRTSEHCTDLAKMIGAPVVRVNGDCPEAVVKATKLVTEYQRKFKKDVFLDLLCYRRHGHNELDDPTFTNPALYKVIHSTRTIPDVYADQLIEQGVLSKEEVQKVVSDHSSHCNEHFAQIESHNPKRTNLKGEWTKMREPGDEIQTWNTGLSATLLKYVGAQTVKIPEGFILHNHLQKHLVEARMKKLTEGTKIDWGLAEALAIGSLLYQGYNVRISGQDVGRATFAHRHAMLVNQENNEIYVPLNHLQKSQEDPVPQGYLELANSILSEEAVLGFEYGMSVESPNNLIIWEAQFGDFFNGAQIILDTYLSSGESKWGLQSGLVMLLPHGMDGAGPEHSSCRIERWLQMSDSSETKVDSEKVNWNVVNPTTAAQYFHLLRRQMIRDFRKPLVVVGPKILLRLPGAMSELDEMASGTSFKPVLGHAREVQPKSVKKVIFVSGKHYYALNKYAEENRIEDVVLIRVEQLCPFPTKELQEQVDKYPKAKTFIWSQEEHKNMGAWSFVQPRFRNLVGVNLKYAGRPELCQPAVGVGKVHQEEAQHVIESPFKL